MNFLYYVFILLLPFSFSYPHQYSSNFDNFLHMFMKQPKINSYPINRKFGSSQQHIFRLMPLHYQQQQVQNPSCLPQIWTCGPNLPPCCPGLMCYDGNVKRGRHCVARG